MGGRVVAVAVLAVVGCGRVGFDETTDGGGTMIGDGSTIGCPSFALFCDDFETGDYSHWTTTSENGVGMLNMSTTVVHAGSFALDGFAPPDTSDGAQAYVEQRFTARTSGVLGVRFWMQLSTEMKNFSHVMTLYNRNTEYVALGGDDLANWVVTEYPGGADDFDLQTLVHTPAADAWRCVELVYTFAPAHIEVFVDNVRVLDAVSPATAPVFDRILLGVTRADRVGLHSTIDDFVLAPQRLGC